MQTNFRSAGAWSGGGALKTSERGSLTERGLDRLLSRTLKRPCTSSRIRSEAKKIGGVALPQVDVASLYPLSML